MLELLKKLMKTGSVSGRETKICDIIKAECEKYADEVYTDNLGNLYAHKRGFGKKIMLAAHMDEIGFFATFIEDSGRVRITPVGGINFNSAAYSSVVFENGVKGILVPEEGLSDDCRLNADKYYIDIGTVTRKQSEKKIKIGDFVTVESSLTKLFGKRYVGRPFDNRIGCAVLIECLKNLKNSVNDVYFVFTVAEEVGCRGALPAAFNVAPDYSVAVDVTSTGDTPGAKSMAVKLGGGAAIKIRDNSAICDLRIVEKLTELAKEKKIKHQHEILARGGTDTGAMQRSGRGSVAGAVSVPTRFIHSSVEMIDMSDVDACIKLIGEFINSSL